MDKIDNQENENGLSFKKFKWAGDTDQIIVAHKQIDKDDHIVFAHDTKQTEKLRCFRLHRLENETYRAEPYVTPEELVSVAHLFGIDENTK